MLLSTPLTGGDTEVGASLLEAIQLLSGGAQS